MPILHIAKVMDEVDVEEVKDKEKTLEAYRHIKLRIEITEGLGLSVGGKFPNCIDLHHLSALFDVTTRDKTRTLLCLGARLDEDGEQHSKSYEERDLIHNYTERESLYIAASGSYILMGFRRMHRIFEVIEELMYFVSLQ